jgi:hypothetical protein
VVHDKYLIFICGAAKSKSVMTTIQRGNDKLGIRMVHNGEIMLKIVQLISYEMQTSVKNSSVILQDGPNVM